VLLSFGLTQKPTSYPYFMWLFLFCHMLILGYYPGFRQVGEWRTMARAMNTSLPDFDVPRERNDWSQVETSVLSPVNPDLDLPIFSVCIVVRDRPELLKKAVASVLENSFRDFELVIIDDGSAIPVTEVLAPHPYSADPRVRVFRQAQHGISPARNHALKVAKGVFITVLDSDDELASNALRLLHDFLVATSSLWVYADYQEMGEEVCRLIRLPEYRSAQSMLRGILTRPRLPFKHSGMTIQRDLLLSMGGYDESLRLFEDIDLMLRGLRAGIHPRRLAEPIVRYHWHNGNITRQRRLHGISIWFQLIDLHRPTRVPGGNARMKMLRAAGELGKWLVRLGG
jgi:GT2 family glycosyltransferase